MPGRSNSRITAEPLERELAIRKMELDADQLERLRNADMERARRDEERRRALEFGPGQRRAGAASSGAGCRGARRAAPQPSATNAPPLDPAAPPATGAVPAIPPSSASAPGVVVPPAPGQEAQYASPPVDPAAAPPAGSVAPGAPPAGAYRQRSARERQLQVRDQVLRNLNNAN